VTRVVVLAAVDVEARGLARHLGLARVPGASWPHFAGGALQIACVGLRASQLRARADRLRPFDLVVSAGACGALAPELTAGDLVVPHLVLDATTTAEDRTFWSNGGFDLEAILSAIAENASGTSERGASTITQQLVRARMLPEDVVAPGSDRYIRKAKEILQSMRLNETYPGEEGKERVIGAYLNEIYYGHKAYGIAAAAKVYFGVADLAQLTPAQAALLAALPKSPSTLDPYSYAEEVEDGQLVVPKDAPPVVRRDYILRNL